MGDRDEFRVVGGGESLLPPETLVELAYIGSIGYGFRASAGDAVATKGA